MCAPFHFQNAVMRSGCTDAVEWMRSRDDRRACQGCSGWVPGICGAPVLAAPDVIQ